MIGDKDKRKPTAREIQFLQLLSEGKKCKEIAATLEIADSTVITFIRRLRFRLDVANSNELVYVASKMNLI